MAAFGRSMGIFIFTEHILLVALISRAGADKTCSKPAVWPPVTCFKGYHCCSDNTDCCVDDDDHSFPYWIFGIFAGIFVLGLLITACRKCNQTEVVTTTVTRTRVTHAPPYGSFGNSPYVTNSTSTDVQVNPPPNGTFRDVPNPSAPYNSTTAYPNMPYYGGIGNISKTSAPVGSAVKYNAPSLMRA